MTVWKLTLAYDGTPYHGWQIQPGLATVQGTLAQALHHITRERVLPQGSGRTDTGVHALGQVASFALAAPIPPLNLLRALNRALPASIRVLAAEHASGPGASCDGDRPFHARHSALLKTYEYRIFPRVPDSRRRSASAAEYICPPTLAPFVWDCPWHLDLDRARQAAARVLGEHDFSSFAAADFDLNLRTSGEPISPVREIFASGWHLRAQPDGSPGLLVYQVTGSGFLHHMVRNLVGTFVDAASGRLDPAAIPAILAARDRRRAGQTAPASGLFLVSVEYPKPSATAAEQPGQAACQMAEAL